jgi:hypothetical protein
MEAETKHEESRKKATVIIEILISNNKQYNKQKNINKQHKKTKTTECQQRLTIVDVLSPGSSSKLHLSVFSIRTIDITMLCWRNYI